MHYFIPLTQFEKEVYDIVGSSWRLKDSDQVIAISRIMLRAETPSQRVMLLQVRLAVWLLSNIHYVCSCRVHGAYLASSSSSSIQVLQASEDTTCLRKFLSLHGLQLLWSWMVDTSDSDTPEVLHFRLQVDHVTSCEVMWLSSLVSSPRAPPGKKRSGERSRIPWAYSPKRWKTNEIARSLIIT